MAARTNRTSCGSGVPNVGAPVCIDIDDANDPKMTGAPGRTIWQKAMPASASARVCVADAATVTGAIAPPRMNGVMSMIWLAAAYARADPSMLKSHDIGELALARPM